MCFPKEPAVRRALQNMKGVHDRSDDFEKFDAQDLDALRTEVRRLMVVAGAKFLARHMRGFWKAASDVAQRMWANR